MIELIPAIDLIANRAVRLTNGDFANIKDYADPRDLAKKYADFGLTKLHLVDLDGARDGSPRHLKVLEEIASSTPLQIDFSGGLRSKQDIESAFSAGASQIVVGSIAVKTPEEFFNWLNTYGSEKIILAADFKGEKIACSGWQEESKITLNDFISDYIQHKGIYALCTDIDRDGMLQGPATETYRTMQKNFSSLKIIVSGGVSSMQDIIELNSAGLYGVVIGKALLEGKISLESLVKFKEDYAKL